eukprot:scaffold76008_cov19-Tisochrysis_lutea.AAC.2
MQQQLHFKNGIPPVTLEGYSTGSPAGIRAEGGREAQLPADRAVSWALRGRRFTTCHSPARSVHAYMKNIVQGGGSARVYACACLQNKGWWALLRGCGR